MTKRLRVADKTDDQVRGSIAAYYACVSYMDFNVGRLLAALERLGLAERTIVVYTTDHGELLFEHGMLQKHCFYESAVGVPLIVAAPGLIRSMGVPPMSSTGVSPVVVSSSSSCHALQEQQDMGETPMLLTGGTPVLREEAVPAGAVREHIVGLLDLFPTLCELTGVQAPAGLEGRSITDVLAGTAGLDGRATFSEFYSWAVPERMLRTGRWKYIYTHGDIDQLYDLAAEPLERTNLAEESAHQSVRADLRRRVLEGWELPAPEIIARPKNKPVDVG